jgi:hypothetical protein
MTQATPVSIPLLHGRYRIEEQLGSGRLAVVYRAYDERLQRQVLVHMLRKELLGQEALRQRFVQEAHTNARRSHQSLLEIFDSGEIAGRPYMITEYVAGRTLRELGALSLEEALLYFRQLVGAVATCQLAGVPHPPISSSNVILVDDGHVELLENWRTPHAEIALDSACYRAPERTAGGAASYASAVYALGLLLIEMLTGSRVIRGDDPRVVAQAHLTTQIPALSQIRPLLYAPSLEQLVQRATARDPAQRPPDAATLGQALDDLRRDMSGDTRRLDRPPARPPGLRERINRSTGQLIAARPAPREAYAPAHARTPLEERSAPAHPREAPEEWPARRGTYVGQGRRSLTGMAILVTMLFVFACGGYYGISLALDKLAAIQLPRPDIALPGPSDLGIDLPSWLTGVVGGGGKVWVVNIEGIEGLNLREAPGTTASIITYLPSGTHVRQIGGPSVVDGVEWLQIRTKIGDRELEGWVSKLYLKPE